MSPVSRCSDILDITAWLHAVRISPNPQTLDNKKGTLLNPTAQWSTLLVSTCCSTEQEEQEEVEFDPAKVRLKVVGFGASKAAQGRETSSLS